MKTLCHIFLLSAAGFAQNAREYYDELLKAGALDGMADE
jgi:hypothetical protein